MTLRIISSASVRRALSPDIGAEPRGVSTTATVSVSGDFYLASGKVRLTSFAARWTLVSCATLASVLYL